MCIRDRDKKKPPSKLTHAVRDAPANLILSQVHREVRQSEDDNVGVEAAHKVEPVSYTHLSHRTCDFHRIRRSINQTVFLVSLVIPL